jgi:TRAP-type C4-dicarboxylate transport system permease small subunit
VPESIGFAARLLHVIRTVEKLLCITAFAVLIAVIFADVLSRELTGAGLYWASQTGVWANVLVVMAGFGLASTDGAHLRPRFADGWLPECWVGTLQFLQQITMALFCLALAVLSLLVVLGSWQLGEVDIDLFLPIWPVQAALPAAFFAAALRYAIYGFCPALRPTETSALAITGAHANPDAIASKDASAREDKGSQP